MDRLMNSKYVDHILYILLMFFVGSFVGFIWEVIVCWFQHTKSLLEVIFELRGFLNGMWVPIYGIGIVLIYLLSIKLKGRKFIVFISSACICSVIEYVTAWGLENFFHLKLWDYSHQFLNRNGRICLLSILFFGLAGLLIAIWIEPIFKKIYMLLPKYIHRMLGVILTLMFAFDLIISLMTKYK